MIGRRDATTATRVHLLTTALASVVALLSVVPAPAVAAPTVPVAAQPGTQPGAADPRPNVVVFMLDDLPPLDGRLYKVLPNIKSIFVNHGVQFSDFRSETPLCCPARAGFLTGQHTWHHGVDRNDARLFDPSMTLATQLQGVGYQTMLVGKYLNGYSELAPVVPPGWDKFSAKEGAYFNYRFWNDGSPKVEKHGSKPSDYLTHVESRKIAADFAAADPTQPIFAWFAMNAPHKPWTPDPSLASDARCNTMAPWNPPNYAEKDVSDKPAYVQASARYDPAQLRDKGGFDLKTICRTMLPVDLLVGQIKNLLASHKRLKNTIFVFSGDNGMNFGSHRLGSKLGPYETGIPFFVSWPAKLGTTPRTVTDTVMNIDFAPTICELAGCTLGPYPNGQAKPDGKSFAALLLGTADSMQRDSIVEDLPAGDHHVPVWYAVRSTGASPLKDAGCEQAATNGCRWHYIRYLDGFEELYDDSGGPCPGWNDRQFGDPCELTNLASDSTYLPILTAMRYRLTVLAGNPMGSRKAPGGGQPG